MKEVAGSIRALNISLITSILILSLISMVIAFVFAYRLAKPINQMEEFTEKLKEGKTAGGLFIKAGGEMQHLAANINYLVEMLQNQISAANEEKSKVLSAFASMSEGVLVLDIEDRIEAYNRAFRNMIGSRYGEIRGKTLIEAFRSTDLQDFYERFMPRKTPCQKRSNSRNLPQGHRYNNFRYQGPAHNDRKTMLVFHDVTRLKKLEK